MLQWNVRNFYSPFLTVVMLGCRYDVNVTPDKRKVFLHHEAEVLQTLQEVICYVIMACTSLQ